MNFHGASAVHEAQRLAMISSEKHRTKEPSIEGPSSQEAEPPTLAGCIVYVVAVIGFVIMCVSCALR